MLCRNELGEKKNHTFAINEKKKNVYIDVCLDCNWCYSMIDHPVSQNEINSPDLSISTIDSFARLETLINSMYRINESFRCVIKIAQESMCIPNKMTSAFFCCCSDLHLLIPNLSIRSVHSAIKQYLGLFNWNSIS